MGADLRYATPAARWVMLATVLGSGMAFLDSTVVNVALPAIGRDLDASLGALQWTVNGYVVTLASLILLAGALSDRYGRRRIFLVGAAWFAAASVLCGLAPNETALIAGRALQGVGGALLTPGSLAILQASFHRDDRARAIGAWSGLTGVGAAIGPFLGGWLVDVASWRLVFLINAPLAAVVIAVALRHVPESFDEDAPRHLDVAGSVLGVAALFGVTFSLIHASEHGFADAGVVASGIAGVAAFVAFLVVEARRREPMMPLEVFRSRQFSGANLVTFPVYAALAGTFFFTVVQLQQVAGYSALAAGAAMVPATLLLFLLSSRAGALAARIGPRLPMTLGPLVIAAGMVLMVRIDAQADYVTDVLPAVVVFGLGLSLTVAPLTATVLAAVATHRAGIASGINNAVARAAALLAVAVLPLVAGLAGEDYRDPVAFNAGFRVATLTAAGLAALGGVIAWLTIRKVGPAEDDEAAAHEPSDARGADAPCTFGVPVRDVGLSADAAASRRA